MNILRNAELAFCYFAVAVVIAVVVIAGAGLSGCAMVSTTDRYADGRKVETTALEFGRTEAIQGFTDVQTKDGRAIGVGSASADVNTQAIKESGALIGNVVGAALKAYTGRP